jgi:uncharacterized membrane protein YbhN (UPF0104 family)
LLCFPLFFPEDASHERGAIAQRNVRAFITFRADEESPNRLCDASGVQGADRITAEPTPNGASASAPRQRSPAAILRRTLPWAVAAAILWYLFRKVPVSEAWHAARQAHLELFVACTLVAVLVWFLAVAGIPITPAGLGTQQAAMLYFFSSYGSEAAILAFALAFPVALTLARMPLGLLYIRDLAALRSGAKLRAD